MITLTIIILAALTLLLWLGFTITGALLGAVIWICIKIPLAVILWALGVICCCTIILIPVGVGLFKAGAALLLPGF